MLGVHVFEPIQYLTISQPDLSSLQVNVTIRFLFVHVLVASSVVVGGVSSNITHVPLAHCHFPTIAPEE